MGLFINVAFSQSIHKISLPQSTASPSVRHAPPLIKILPLYERRPTFRTTGYITNKSQTIFNPVFGMGHTIRRAPHHAPRNEATCPLPLPLPLEKSNILEPIICSLLVQASLKGTENSPCIYNHLSQCYFRTLEKTEFSGKGLWLMINST